MRPQLPNLTSFKIFIQLNTSVYLIHNGLRQVFAFYVLYTGYGPVVFLLRASLSLFALCSLFFGPV